MSADFSFNFDLSNARIQAQAWIHGIPRERNSRSLQISREVRKNLRVARIDASMGIVGLSGTGRKFLAYRLANMNRGVISRVPIASYYTISYDGRFVDSVDSGFGRYYLRITVFVIPVPKFPPKRTRSDDFRYSGPPLYQQHWDNFSCLVMAFDVKNLISFLFAPLRLSEFRRCNFRIPTVFLVGNKRDLRSGSPENDGERFVNKRTAYTKADNIGGTYFEVSAMYNINVTPLLSKILECVLQRTENWHEE